MANTTHTGTTGDVTFGSDALCVTSWTATENVESQTTTSKCDGGIRTVKGGVKSLDISFEANWDSSVYEGETAPEIACGDYVTAELELYEDGPSITGEFMVTTVDYASPVDGLVTISVSAENNGPYTLPLGSSS